MNKKEARHLARLAAECEELRKENARLSSSVRSLIHEKVGAKMALVEIKRILDEVDLEWL